MSHEMYSGQGALFVSCGAAVGFVSTNNELSHWELHFSLKGRAAIAQTLQLSGRERISSGQFGSPRAYHGLVICDM